jgi:glycosyltransferase involved in cell wall biosynthesis
MKKIKIGYASCDWSRTIIEGKGPIAGGANWVRLQQTRPHTGFNSVTGLLVFHEKKGFGVVDWFNKSHYDCNVIVTQRLMFKNLAEQMHLRKKWNQVIINDIDDWYWGLHKDNHAYKMTHPDHNPNENIDHYKSVIQQGDGVVTSTPFLYEKMKNEFGCRNVHLIENCVTVSDFRQRMLNTKKPVVGWVGSTSHRSGDLETIAPVLDNRSFRLHHSGHVNGAVPFAKKIALPDNRVTKSPMYPPEQYAKHAFVFDIGVAPINDIPFNHAKSWIKAIEYAAAGVPFVASDVGEYRRLYDTYGIGRLASTDDEWKANIEELCNHRVRSAEAKKQKQAVMEHLNVDKMGAEWRKVLSLYI